MAKTEAKETSSTQVFLSYSSRDRATAGRLADALARDGLDVFWDRSILAGVDFTEVIQMELELSRSVVVLWSASSVGSRWVRSEANWGIERGILIEVKIDASRPPLPFGQLQTPDLSNWTGSRANAEYLHFLQAVRSKVKPSSPSTELAAPRRGARVTDDHLAMIHTSWRSPKHDLAFEALMYRWDLAVFGTAKALDRIEEVTYYLHPAYESPDARPPSYSVYRYKAHHHRSSCFRLSQLANGHSLVRAYIKIAGQVEPVKLSRYINLFDSTDRITAFAS
ncbi:toll/interleukin-1 receptor domain-containing protein [Variovorax sp. J22R115]|uniref:toll/interleukin-1 receptor domain-containing protein n=1 Tax=Variovorax sp. J22R115 TaxID=3053509 RepID=UPI00257803EF|nr:toll/interleukin-1 receptor domain-containing protein [Variovorax sp. J22R115]MDM0053754.1 toll/interleukin-1 receptor domain-containing protein [Variovorax sp. J22R115]